MEKERESRIYNISRDSLPTDREEDASKSIWSRGAISRQGEGTLFLDQMEWKATCCYPPQSPVMEYKPTAPLRPLYFLLIKELDSNQSMSFNVFFQMSLH